MSKIIVEVKKNPGENNANLLRRFSRKVIESGTVQKVKGGRYSERKPSKLTTKKKAMKKMVRRNEIEKLKKLGKVSNEKR